MTGRERCSTAAPATRRSSYANLRGATRFLETAPTLPLGVDEEQRTPSVQALQPRSTLAAFTDGLVEQRDES